MVTVDAKYLVRPITRDMAITDFEQGNKVFAFDGEPDNISSFQIFYPNHHSLHEVENWGYVTSKWFADWS